jgi:hypothetical protein
MNHLLRMNLYNYLENQKDVLKEQIPLLRSEIDVIIGNMHLLTMSSSAT